MAVVIAVILFWGGLGQGNESYFRQFQMSWGDAPSCAALIYYFARIKSRWSAAVEAPFVILLGDASYSIYFLHGWFISLLCHGGMTDYRLAIFKIAVAWTLTAFAAVGVYRYFEAPARRAIRAALAGNAERREQAAAVASGASVYFGRQDV
jgi:peptidoglycan/LPS O-acetylase OafA/YrhL